jgi:phage gp16-like protein
MIMDANKKMARTRLIRLIHVARRELEMDEDTYRIFLANLPGLDGATSCKDLAIPKLRLVLDAFKLRGFKVRPKAGASTNKRPLADDPQSKLIRHLWLKLHAAGAVRDPSEQALGAFVKAMTKVGALQWLSSYQASKVIEHLKSWLARTDEVADDE